jgi:glycosidase
MFFSRGVPTLYYGDEQGFIGDGHDNDAREDMMPSKVAVYNDNDLILNEATTADDNFQTSTRLFQDFQKLIALRKASSALKYGKTKIVEQTSKPGILAFIRQDKDQTLLAIINNSPDTKTIPIAIPHEMIIQSLIYGEGKVQSQRNGSFDITLTGLTSSVIELKSKP